MKLTIYRILSFLLLPMALLFSVLFLLFLRAAFANPALFLPLFLFGCIAIYSFATLNFIIRGIDGEKLLGRSSKEWLLVNAFVSLLCAAWAVAQGVFLFLHPESVREMAAQAKLNAGDALKASEEEVIQYLNALSYFLLVYGVVLFVHIIMSFQFVKKYRYLFQNVQQQGNG